MKILKPSTKMLALMIAGVSIGIVAASKLGWQDTVPANEAEFLRWRESAVENHAAFSRFEAYLTEEGVAEVVPVWQLLRVDTGGDGSCSRNPFIVPPESEWRHIVPTLKLIDERIKPSIGDVEVVSAYRPPEANLCSGGASKSRHLTFEALDLRALSGRVDAPFHEELCEIWRAAGPSSAMGLGAYFDPSDDSYNRQGRFHVDITGYRTWGRDYTSKSSPCI